ncbi:MAG TPA: tetratricopeptide repeat protein, partial [Woeseiaceae bacterium]|nr:tetratricopeptide repeat protein [Woeseiaceae bacterium]
MSNTVPDGSPDAALAEIRRLLGSDAALASVRATELLRSVPGHPLATLYLGMGRRLAGDPTGAIEALEPLARARPEWAVAHYELGRALGAAGRGGQAIAALRRATALEPALPGAWCSLAAELRAAGDATGADAVVDDRIRVSAGDPRLGAASAAVRENRLAEANTLLRRHLDADPTDVVAMRMLAEVGSRLGQHADAAMLLARCLELAPGYAAARHLYAITLNQQMRFREALREISLALDADPGNANYRTVKAALLVRTGDFDRAIDEYADVLAEYEQQPRIWMSYGDALKAAGRQADSIAAYRRSIAISPELGEAWWGLADLKTWTFAADDIAGMRRQIRRSDLSADDRLHFEFALGKALED